MTSPDTPSRNISNSILFQQPSPQKCGDVDEGMGQVVAENGSSTAVRRNAWVVEETYSSKEVVDI